MFSYREWNTIVSVDPILLFLHQITIQGKLKRKWTLSIIFLNEEQNLYEYFLLLFCKKQKKKIECESVPQKRNQ